MAKRLTGVSVLELVLVFVVALAAVAPVLFIKHDEDKFRRSARDTGENLRDGWPRVLAGHVETIESHRLEAAGANYERWKNFLDEREKKLGLPVDEEEFKKSPYFFGGAVPRNAREFRRAIVALEFALTGVRGLNELVAEKAKNPVGAFVDSVGVKETSESENILRGKAWNPATGDLPGMEFVDSAIERALGVVDSKSAELKYFRSGDYAPGLTGIAKLEDAKDRAGNARRNWIELLEFEAKSAKLPDEQVKKVADLRKELDAVTDKFHKYVSDKSSSLLGVKAGARDEKTVDLDKGLLAIEKEAAGVLAKISNEAAKIRLERGRKAHGDAVTALLLGRKGTDKDGNEVLVGGLAQVNGNVVQLPTSTDAKTELEKLFPRDKAPSTKGPAARVSGMKDLYDRAGSTPAVAIIVAAQNAAATAREQDALLNWQRLRLIEELAAIEPLVSRYKELAARLDRARIPTAQFAPERQITEGKKEADKFGALKLSQERLQKTLDEAELDVYGDPLKDKDGNPRPGLRKAMENAKAEQKRIKELLVVLYKRADETDKVERDRFTELKAQSDKIEALVKDIKQGKGDPSVLIGPIREPEKTGEIGKFEVMAKEFRTLGEAQWPFWWKHYSKLAEDKAASTPGTESNEVVAKVPPPPLPDIDWNGASADIIKALHARSPKAQADELAGLDEAKAGKIREMPVAERNAALAAAPAAAVATVYDKLLTEKLDETVKAIDWFTAEKLISHYEAKLVRWPKAEAVAGFPTLAARMVVLGEADKFDDPAAFPVVREAPVAKAKLDASEAKLTDLQDRINEYEKDAKAIQDQLEGNSSDGKPGALAAIRQAALRAAGTSAELIKREAAVADLFEDAVLRYLPAAEAAADALGTGWMRAIVGVEQATVNFAAAEFYLRQQERLRSVDETFRSLAASVPDLGALGEDTDPAVKHLATVRKILDAGPASADIDVVLFNPAKDKPGFVQPLPMLRIAGGTNSPSLIETGLAALWRGRRAWAEEAGPTNINQFTQAKQSEFFRIHKRYADMFTWTFNVSAGSGFALATRVLEDKTLLKGWTPTFTPATLLQAVPNRPQTIANVYDATVHYLSVGMTVNLVQISPELRLGPLSGLDSADPAYLNRAPAETDDIYQRRVGFEILKRIGVGEKMYDFLEAMRATPAP